MGFSVGIVGLPNVGKSTLFNALTNAKADAANYPFCTIEANEGVVALHDVRVDALAALFKSKKKIYATISFADIAGLVKGAAQGEGLGNKFLSHIREVDAIAHVVRCFENDDIQHVHGGIDPLRDIEVIATELILKDIETLTKRMERNERSIKGAKTKELIKEIETLEKCEQHLNEGKLLSTLNLDSEEKEAIRPLFFITIKPMMLAANLDESELAKPEQNAHYKTTLRFANENGFPLIPFSAKIEQELSELSREERDEYLKEIGVAASGIDRLAASGYRLLNLITYLTTGEDETRAWTITNAMKAPEAAGVIHSDFQRGFISAEVVDYEKLIQAGSFAKAKEAGALRLEGKEYIMKDGDVVVFRFNV